jgi:hypothetical protein
MALERARRVNVLMEYAEAPAVVTPTGATWDFFLDSRRRRREGECGWRSHLSRQRRGRNPLGVHGGVNPSGSMWAPILSGATGIVVTSERDAVRRLA